MKIQFFILIALVTMGSIKCNIFEDLTNTIGDAFNGIARSACVAQHSDEFTECYNMIRNVYIGSGDPSARKENCCQFLAYRDCMELVAQKYCGTEARKIVDKTMNVIKGAGLQCADYQNLFDCMDKWLAISILAFTFLLAVAVVSCVIKAFIHLFK